MLLTLGRQISLSSAEKGDIDIHPEFSIQTESLLQPSPANRRPEKVYEVVRWHYKIGSTSLLNPAAYQNTYAIAVPKKIAQEYGLDDFRLEKVEGQLK